MKIIPFSLLVLVGLACLFSSCDKISPPYQDVIVVDTTNKRTVLLEDFTGHRCVNCPQAHKIVHELDSIYGDRFVAIGVHAGVFAIPIPPVYTYNFGTASGTDLNNTFGISTYPSGMVNRRKVNNSIIIDKGSWATEVANILAIPADADISITNTWNSSNRSLNVKVDAEFFNNLNGAYRLCVYLIEDNIIKPQKNNDASIDSVPDVLAYKHMHVLRDAINSTWGDLLVNDPVQGQTVSKTFTGFSFNADWNENNCKVVAFIYRDDDDDGTRYEVVQAKKAKVK